jgi:NADH-quinone oxidoreductase subunit A
MTSTYLTNWLYVWLFVVAGAGLVVLILLFSKLINPSHLTPAKLAPYECGIPPVGNPWAPFAVRYYVFGLLFLVFDVEAVFLFPWALVFRGLGTSGFVEMLLFIAVLGVGLLYAWRKGALEWA